MPPAVVEEAIPVVFPIVREAPEFTFSAAVPPK